MLFHTFIKKAIQRGSANKNLSKALYDARYQKAIYTGKDQDFILLEYREKESDNQKKQRSRITITRTKHKSQQIENTINLLDIMDKPQIKVISEDEDLVANMDSFIYEQNLDKLAFDYVKYYNLTDSNTFVLCNMNEFDEVEYSTVGVKNLYDYKIVNKNIKYVMFYNKREVDNRTVTDYTLYHDKGIIYYYNSLDKDIEGKEIVVIDKDTYVVNEIETNLMLAFRLGFLEDMTNNQETTVSIIDSASELFKALIWQGSELDTIDAAHGILKRTSYAKPCRNQVKLGNVVSKCVGGYFNSNGAPTGAKCNKCNGTGLVTHTSNQDIIYYPMQKDHNDNLMDLSKLSHTEFIPTEILDYKRSRIKEIEEDIIKTVFNSSMVTKDEIAKTATETRVDLTGIYATLNKVGEQVSACFVWMVKCAAWLKYEKEVEAIHGYTLDLKLDTIDSLMEKRGNALKNNAPIEVIKAFDMAILKKQNLDSPQFINRFAIWDTYRPFNDKTPNEIQSLLGSLNDTFREKVLYNFFDRVRKAVERNDQDLFFNGKVGEDIHLTRQALIDAEVDKIIEEIQENKRQSIEESRTNFDDF